VFDDVATGTAVLGTAAFGTASLGTASLGTAVLDVFDDMFDDVATVSAVLGIAAFGTAAFGTAVFGTASLDDAAIVAAAADAIFSTGTEFSCVDGTVDDIGISATTGSDTGSGTGSGAGSAIVAEEDVCCNTVSAGNNAATDPIAAFEIDASCCVVAFATGTVMVVDNGDCGNPATA
jgi:hypothetical protein